MWLLSVTWGDLHDTAVFFFQGEDGIRDDLVAGVQTCALPISDVGLQARAPVPALACNPTSGTPRMAPIAVLPAGSVFWYAGRLNTWLKPPPENVQPTRSEERRVGKETGDRGRREP